MSTWYARPVLYVRDAQRSLDFYSAKLGFTEAWRHEHEGQLLIVQMDRAGCELILTQQWPDKAGGGLTFVSVDKEHQTALRAELADRGAPVEPGWWGYDLMVITDPDGNLIYIPTSEA